MAKSNSSKKNDTKSSKPVVEEKPQEQANTQETTGAKQHLRGRSKRNQLTPRQQEILKLLVEGHTNKEIAESLKLSAKTVDAHRASIMIRLQIHHFPGLVKYAVKHHLTSLD